MGMGAVYGAGEVGSMMVNHQRPTTDKAKILDLTINQRYNWNSHNSTLKHPSPNPSTQSNISPHENITGTQLS